MVRAVDIRLYTPGCRDQLYIGCSRSSDRWARSTFFFGSLPPMQPPLPSPGTPTSAVNHPVCLTPSVPSPPRRTQSPGTAGDGCMRLVGGWVLVLGGGGATGFGPGGESRGGSWELLQLAGGFGGESRVRIWMVDGRSSSCCSIVMSFVLAGSCQCFQEIG